MKPPHAIGVRGRKILQMLKILTPPKPRFFWGFRTPPGPQILINPGPPDFKNGNGTPPGTPDFGVPPPEPRFRGTPPDPPISGVPPKTPISGTPPRNPRFWGYPPRDPDFRGYPPRDPPISGDPPPDRGGPPPSPGNPDFGGPPPGRGVPPPDPPISGYPPRPPILGVPPRPRGIPQFFVSPGSKKTVFLQPPPVGGSSPTEVPPPTGGVPPTHFLRGPPPKCVISQIRLSGGGAPPAYIYSIYILYRAIYIGLWGVCKPPLGGSGRPGLDSGMSREHPPDINDRGRADPGQLDFLNNYKYLKIFNRSLILCGLRRRSKNLFLHRGTRGDNN